MIIRKYGKLLSLLLLLTLTLSLVACDNNESNSSDVNEESEEFIIETVE